MLRIYLTGTVCVETPQGLIEQRELVGRQGRLVFAYLATEHRPILRDELTDELWLDHLPPSWEQALSAIVSKLRAALSCAAPQLTLASALGCYQLQLRGDIWIDLEAAAQGIDEAESALRQGHPNDAWGWAQVAYHICRRPFLLGDDGPWATRKREELRSILVRAHECVSEIFIGSGEPALAVKHAREAVLLEPFRETSYHWLMRAHAATGNRAEAVRVYERCRSILADELGVTPSAATEAVYRDILRGCSGRARSG